MDPELSSFLMKFQGLCRAGKEAKLSFTSKNGRTIVSLNLEIGRVHPQSQFVQPRPKHRNGPSRERRRMRRAEARKNAAVEATKELSVVETEVLVMAEKATASENNSTSIDTIGEVTDEVCPDDKYLSDEQVIEEITVTPDTIAQLDGVVDIPEEEILRFSFESTYHDDDIKELLSEIFQQAKVNFTLESRMKVSPRSANEVYTIAIKAHDSKMKVSWPEMKGDQSDVFQNVKRLK